MPGQSVRDFVAAYERAFPGEVVRVNAGGGETVLRSPSQAASQDVVYVPRERGLDALFSWMSVRENFAMPTLAR